MVAGTSYASVSVMSVLTLLDDPYQVEESCTAYGEYAGLENSYSFLGDVAVSAVEPEAAGMGPGRLSVEDGAVVGGETELRFDSAAYRTTARR